MKRIFASITVMGRVVGIAVALFVSLFALSFAFSRGPSNQRASLTPAVQAQEPEQATAAGAERAASLPRRGQCTPGGVAGKYGWLIQGTVLPPLTPVTTPGVAVGLIEVDFAGNFTGSDALSLGGQIIPRTYSGTFIVKSDCTFTSRFTVNSGPLTGLVTNTSGVVVDGSNEIYFVETDPSTLFTAVAKRL